MEKMMVAPFIRKKLLLKEYKYKMMVIGVADLSLGLKSCER
jgi:hypothetical protein